MNGQVIDITPALERRGARPQCEHVTYREPWAAAAALLLGAFLLGLYTGHVFTRPTPASCVEMLREGAP